MNAFTRWVVSSYTPPVLCTLKQFKLLLNTFLRYPKKYPDSLLWTFFRGILQKVVNKFSTRIFFVIFGPVVKVTKKINPFQLSVAFHIETSDLFCSAKQMAGFYMKRNTRLKWIDGNLTLFVPIFSFSRKNLLNQSQQ